MPGQTEQHSPTSPSPARCLQFKMQTPQNFKVPIFPKDKTLFVTTLSPTGEFYYRIKTPKDLYWGLFCGQIAFFDRDNNLLYHKQNQLAQFSLTLSNPWKVVAWSSSGTIAYFIERNSVDTCWHVLLDLQAKKVCRLDHEESDKEIFETISDGDFEDSIIKANPFFEFNNFVPEKIEHSVAEFFGISNWRPK